ncbi:S1 RNA-binding domain-containing protein [Spirulina sp. CS-785/01]|uniref:S1 RNA-binding domain-containing protein n=1 Tax=Spirulina sp. CS-785/01 TaxID=3021716 RepID=UPI00232FB7EE|nr:S1 RNA-binding domain-containing protein [Spirulina sp. CS-785/01]MDB9312429.1 S1 RNA-binding domain-containing protein [Spirulina sp. CS-785/01]
MTSESSHSSNSNISFSMDDFMNALEQGEYDDQLRRGQVVRGKVYEHTANGALIDLSGQTKASGFVPIDEAALSKRGTLDEVLPLNEECEFLVLRKVDSEGQILLSRRQLAIKKAWDEMAEMKSDGQVVEMRVTGVNRGGVIGQVKGLRAFIPRSHLTQKENLDSLVGQLLLVTCLEVDPDRRKLVLSQREAARSQAIQDIEPGTLVEGRVVSLQPYGAFVDIGGVTGLLHVKQISELPVQAPNTVVQIGQPIKVVIADVDEYKNRLSFATKPLESYPGEILEKFEVVMANAEERLEAAQQKAAEQEKAETQPPQPEETQAETKTEEE